MRAHVDDFLHYVADVGGERRAPKRAAALRAQRSSGGSAGFDRQPSEQRQRSKLDELLNEMEKDGIWGGAMEISAFAQEYGRDVDVFSDNGVHRFHSSQAEEEKQMPAYIAFHVSTFLMFGFIVKDRRATLVFSALFKCPQPFRTAYGASPDQDRTQGYDAIRWRFRPVA